MDCIQLCTFLYTPVLFQSYVVHQAFFFFLMLRRPPISTLFPYRRSSDLNFEQIGASGIILGQECRSSVPPPGRGRSEEHTSELQSHSELVCRLLLEKKNANTLVDQQHLDQRLDFQDELVVATDALRHALA